MNLELLNELEAGISHIERVSNGVEAGDVEALFGKLIERAVQVAGEESPEYGLALRARASFYRNRGEAARAVAEYNRVLPLLERAGNEGRIQIVQTVTSMAGLYVKLGQLDKVKETVRQAIDLIAEYALYPAHFSPPLQNTDDLPRAVDTAGMLASGVANAVVSAPGTDPLIVFDELIQKVSETPSMELEFLLARAAFEDAHEDTIARETFARAWTLAHQRRGKDFPQLEQWVRLAHLALHGGYVKEALEAAQHIRKLETTRDDRRFLNSAYEARRIETSVAYKGRDADAAEKTLRSLLEFCRGTFGQSDERTIDTESWLSQFLIGTGRSGKAIEMLQHVTNVRMSSSSYPNPQAGEAAFELAKALDMNGNDTEAVSYYSMAYHIYARVSGPTHPNTILSALNLAETARVAHDYETAERWFRIALDAEQKGSGARTAGVAHALNNLAETLLDSGRVDEAAPLAEQGLEIRRELFGQKSREHERSLGVVARIALAQQDRKRLDEVIEESKAISGSNSVQLPVEVLMGYLEILGDIDKAIDVCRQGIKLAERTQDDFMLPQQGMSLRFALGNLCARASRWAEAKQSLLEAFHIESNLLSDEAGLRSQRQMRAMFAESRARIGILLNVLSRDPTVSNDDIRKTYEVIQQRKGLETRLLRLQKISFITDRALTSIPQERLEEIRDDVSRIVKMLRDEREKWLAALIREVDRSGSDPEGISVMARQDRVERLERQLAGYVGQGSRDFEMLSAGAGVPALAEGSAVVEYFFDESREPTYYAFVLTHKMIRFIPLGEAGQIHQALLQLRAQVVEAQPKADDPDPPWQRRSRFLANRLLKPLLPLLEGITQLYLAPDAELFTLPFELLPLDDEKMVIDRWTVSYLWHGGELSKFNVIFGNPASPTQPVVISAPTYGEDLGRLKWHFATLPYASREGETVAKKIGAVHLHGTEAAKAAMVNYANAEILHFATHSFFTSHALTSVLPQASEARLFQVRSLLANPMLRSGIALSGADLELNTPTAASEGILFASEVLDMDLRNTDLVVLSSCQSGLGDPRPGDGIQGLRRAFRAAGCSSVVSSLWKVPDEAAYEFMIDFYDRLLKKMPRGQALRETKLALRKRYPKDPLFWAGFVLDGSDRPLFRFSGFQGLRVANFSGVGLSYDGALEHITHQRWDEAITSLNFVLNSRTADDELRAKAAVKLASVFRQTGRLGESIEVLNKLIANIRTPAEILRSAMVDRAITKQLSNDLDGAHLDYTAVLQMAETSAETRALLLVNRGVLLSIQEKAELALADWSEVILNPKSPKEQLWKALLDRSDQYGRMNRYEESIADATRLVEMPNAKGSAERETAFLVLALSRSAMGDLEGAISAVRHHLKERKIPAPRGASKQLNACKTSEQLQQFVMTLL